MSGGGERGEAEEPGVPLPRRGASDVHSIALGFTCGRCIVDGIAAHQRIGVDRAWFRIRRPIFGGDGWCLSSPHSSLMSQDIVLATKLGGGACPHSVATSSTQLSLSIAAPLSWPASTASRGGGFTSWSRGSTRAATRH